MAFTKVLAFNWDNAIARHSGESLASLLKLKAKAAELTMKTDKFVKPRAPIDFAYYKEKCHLTKSGYVFLEKLYKEDNIPKFHAVIPPLTLQKRAASSAVLKDIAILAQEDIELLKIEIQELGPKRITNTTTFKDMTDRYPQFARQIEAEINEEIWCYNDDYNTL